MTVATLPRSLYAPGREPRPARRTPIRYQGLTPEAPRGDRDAPRARGLAARRLPIVVSAGVSAL